MSNQNLSPDYNWVWRLGPESLFNVTTNTSVYPIGVKKLREPKLVYIDPDIPVAYFSEGDAWGDDWDDAPYEHNAGTPYDWTTRVVYLDTDLESPCSNKLNSDYSVEQINKGMIPWLRTPTWYKHIVVIPAGVTVQEFIDKIRAADGIAIIVPEKEVTSEEE
jgi:hypothetical protein